MKQKSADDIESIRLSLREYLPELRVRYGVTSLGIFGSYVHGQQKKRSDVDLLVEFDENAHLTFVNFLALERMLGKRLGHKVDLVERDSLKPVIGQRILAEVIPV